MKIKYKYFALWLTLVCPFLFTSCDSGFLKVSDPTVMSTDTYPATVSDLETILVDIYGRLQNTSWMGNRGTLSSHEQDHGYNGANYNEYALIELNADIATIQQTWEAYYISIGKINGLLASLDQFRAKGTLTAAQLTRIGQMEGEARFIRAYDYFYLVNIFGEAPVLTASDLTKMGVPLWDVLPSTVQTSAKARATQGEIYNFITADLTKAETLLKGVVFTEKPRVNEWAVKSLLGKAYVYSLQWDKAKAALKDVIDNSGKGLVDYATFYKMFNLGYEFSKESIFEINYTADKLNTATTESALNTGNLGPRGISVTFIDNKGAEVTNGFGNWFIHDKTMARFGFDDTTTVNQKRPDYIAKSKQVRKDKSVDPRLWASTFQPYVDSVNIVSSTLSGWRKVGKSRVESYPSRNLKAWNNHKYTIISYYFSDQLQTEMNITVLRLADIYLLYAESLIKTGDVINGLEYLNKVHRRAYDQPINSPSIYDYKTLADKTKASGLNDALANNPLQYERFAELFGEYNWWLDVRRWDLGAKEALYYQKVMAGPLIWRPTKYAEPIPTSEINSNSKMVQNPL